MCLFVCCLFVCFEGGNKRLSLLTLMKLMSSLCLVCREPLATVIMSVGGLTELGQLRGNAAVDEAKTRRFPHLKGRWTLGESGGLPAEQAMQN